MRTLWPALLALGCAPDLSQRLQTEDTGPLADSEVDGDVVTTRIDATSEEDWVAYDLEERVLASYEGDPWHLAFRRFLVELGEGVEALPLDGVALDDVEAGALPEEGWRVDAPDADDDGVPEYALADWYDYSVDTHVLTPKDRAWVLRDASGSAWALRFDAYYDDAGTPAKLTFRWTRLAKP